MPRAPRHRPQDDLPPEPPSKTRLKKEMADLQALGEEVAALPSSRLANLPIEERLRDAIAELHRTRSFEGRRRQVQYIGKLMRIEDVAPLREAVAAFKLGSAADTLALHQAEAWRDRLVAGDEALDAWLAEHPATDIQQLRNLVRAARRDAPKPEAEGVARHGRAYRDLFQMVKAALTKRPDDEGHDDGEDLDDRDGGHDA